MDKTNPIVKVVYELMNGTELTHYTHGSFKSVPFSKTHMIVDGTRFAKKDLHKQTMYYDNGRQTTITLHEKVN